MSMRVKPCYFNFIFFTMLISHFDSFAMSDLHGLSNFAVSDSTVGFCERLLNLSISIV